MARLPKPYFGSNKGFYPAAKAMWQDFCDTYKIKSYSKDFTALHNTEHNQILFDHTTYFDTEDGKVIITQPYSDAEDVIQYFKKNNKLTNECIEKHCNVTIYANKRFNWRIPFGIAVIFHIPNEPKEKPTDTLKITVYTLDFNTEEEQKKEIIIKPLK